MKPTSETKTALFVNAKMLSGDHSPTFKGARLFYTSIRLRQEGAGMVVDFLHEGGLVMSMDCPAPNFAAGETLTITGINGSTEMGIV